MDLSVQEREWTPPGNLPPGPPPVPGPPPGSSWARMLVALVVVGAIAASGYIGYAVKRAQDSGSTPTVRNATPVAPDTGSTANSSGSGGTDASSIASTLDDSIVNITTTLDSGGSAAGTGIIISSSGLVLTNNHVIADTTSIRVENSATGNTSRAVVVGYDTADDVALIKIQNASGLTPAPMEQNRDPSIGDAVVALGNAGGQGGAPAVATGRITDLDQQITASDGDGANPETLSHLIQIDAQIQPGDSGGPLVDANGRVIGMDVAASRTNQRFAQFDAGIGYAIPINDALAIAHRIDSGNGGGTIHIGATRGLLGVQVTDDSQSGSGSAADGALVVGVVADSGADAAGIREGDLIVRVNGTSISSPSDLRSVLDPAAPHATVSVTWVDSGGTTHHASVHLSPGPPA